LAEDAVHDTCGLGVLEGRLLWERWLLLEAGGLGGEGVC